LFKELIIFKGTQHPPFSPNFPDFSHFRKREGERRRNLKVFKFEAFKHLDLPLFGAHSNYLQRKLSRARTWKQVRGKPWKGQQPLVRRRPRDLSRGSPRVLLPANARSHLANDPLMILPCDL